MHPGPAVLWPLVAALVAVASSAQRAQARDLSQILNFQLNNHTRTYTGPKRETLLTNYKTATACEGQQLHLHCEDNKLIHVSRAVFGRFSVSICNERGQENLSVNCMSFKTQKIVEQRCNKLTNCTVDASTEHFGEPCEGTPKYLEVQYHCQEVNNNNNNTTATTSVTTTTSNNANSPQQRPPATRIGGAPDAAAVGHKSHTTTTTTSPAQPQRDVGEQQPDATSADETTAKATQLGKSTVITQTTQQQQQQQQYFCAAQASSRNLYWNATSAEHTAQQPCPVGAEGIAEWRCERAPNSPTGARFSPAWAPDFSRCSTSWLREVSRKLARMLDAPAKPQSIELQRMQIEQILNFVVSDLKQITDAKTHSLFADDLRTIDIMLGQIIAQFRSFAATMQFDSAQQQQQQFGEAMLPLYTQLFEKLVSIVSSLFDMSLRHAWLDLRAPKELQRVEMRLLGHLRSAGELLANAYGPASSLAQYQPSIREPNVFAGLTVISTPASAASSNSIGADADASSSGGGNVNTAEFVLNNQMQLAQSLLNKFVTQPDGDQINEFRIRQPVLSELIRSGITRFLVLDVEKPDYALIRRQLESTYLRDDAQDAALPNSAQLLAAEQQQQQWSSKVFGVFALPTDNVDASALRRVHELLVQWPIHIDFRVSSWLSGAAHTQRQCTALGGADNKCHVLMSNSTNHVCRCDQFGFVALTSAPNQVPANQLSDFAWPLFFSNGQSADSQQHSARAADTNAAATLDAGNGFTSAAPQYTVPAARQSTSAWLNSALFALGLVLLVVALGGFVARSAVRLFSSHRLDKKQDGCDSSGALGHLFASGASILTSGGGGGGNMNSGSTTGPLTDHSLLSTEPIVGAQQHHVHQHAGTIHSTSIIGLNQAAACHSYGANNTMLAPPNAAKTFGAHPQPLYAAAHLEAVACAGAGGYYSGASSAGGGGGGLMSARSATSIVPGGAASDKLLAWARTLHPARLLASVRLPWTAGGVAGAKSRANHLGGAVQHRIVAHNAHLHANNTYKSQYQNGYTTALHHQATAGLHHHHHHVHAQHQHMHHQQTQQSSPASQVPLTSAAAACGGQSSSTSSYVSSSAYYEEIGPGNLAKVSHQQPTQQQQQHRTTTMHTIVDPFKRPDAVFVQQQQQQQQMPNTWQQQQQIVNSCAEFANYGQQNQMTHSNNNKFMHSDLYMMQQQHQPNNTATSTSNLSTGSTSVATTPRHYLFTSPSAVNAYKSAMTNASRG